MNCAEFDAALNEILDRRDCDQLAPLHAHAEQCAACRQALDQTRILTEAITHWRRAVPEVDFTNSVILALAEDAPAPMAASIGQGAAGPRPPQPFSASPRLRRTVYAALIALSTMLLVAIFLMTGDPVSPTIVETDTGSQRPILSDNQREDHELAILDQAGDAYGRLAKSAAGALEEFAVIVIPGAGGNVPAVRSTPSADEPLLEGLQQQLQPVGRSLGDALDFLWEVGAPPADSQT